MANKKYDSRISNLDLHLTEDCILRCSYCYVEKRSPQYMSFETATKSIHFLLKESKNLTTLSVSFFGGEPLMAFNLIKRLVPYAERKADYFGKRIRFSATTNMVLINDEIYNFFRRYRIGFHTSVDGLPECHDKHRIFPSGEGSSSCAYKNIDRILKYKPYTTARATVSNDTVTSFYDNIVYLHCQKGYRHIAMIPVVEQEWTPEHIEDFKKQLRLVSDYYIDACRNNDHIIIKHIDDTIRKLIRLRRNSGICGAGRKMLAVSTDGRLYPCHRFATFDSRDRWKLGSIYTGIDHAKRMQLQAIDPRKDAKADCDSCVAVHTCSLGCIAVNWITSNDIYKPPMNECLFRRLYFYEAMRVHAILEKENNKAFMEKFYSDKKNSDDKVDPSIHPKPISENYEIRGWTVASNILS